MTPDQERMEAMLTRLKLTGIRDQLDNLLDEAARKDLTLREALGYLLEAEIARKDQRRFAMGLSIARFPFVRTLEDFDFDAQPSLDRKQVRELATCRWIANGDALLLLGPPGVGKTHLAVGLGRAAIEAGYSTLFVQATHLVAALSKAHAEGRLEDKLRYYGKPKLLIIDELGYLPLERNAAHLACTPVDLDTHLGLRAPVGSRDEQEDKSRVWCWAGGDGGRAEPGIRHLRPAPRS